MEKLTITIKYIGNIFVILLIQYSLIELLRNKLIVIQKPLIIKKTSTAKSLKPPPIKFIFKFVKTTACSKITIKQQNNQIALKQFSFFILRIAQSNILFPLLSILNFV